MKASAPGKIILFGEHAVVYGRPALAVPVTQVRAEVDVSESHRPGIWIDAPDIGLHGELKALPCDQPLAALIRNLLAALQPDPYPDLQDHDHIPPFRLPPGMGSGAAVSVALIRALTFHALGLPLSDEQVSAYAYEIEKLHHGTPSGIDNTVVTYARPVFFVKGQAVETLDVRCALYGRDRRHRHPCADQGMRSPMSAGCGNQTGWHGRLFSTRSGTSRGRQEMTIEEGLWKQAREA